MTIAEARKKLTEAGISSPDIDAMVLAELASGKTREHWLAFPEADVNGNYEELVTRRAKRVPLAHLSGTKEFYGLEMVVNGSVLQPRPESEKIVEFARKYAPQGSRLIDVGTGCGAIAIAIAKHRSDLKVTATEVSPEAIEVAKQNFRKHKFTGELIPSDLLRGVEGQFETVVANLPYLPADAELLPEVKKEPEIALIGGADGLDLYRKFFDQLPDHLASPGFVFIESDPWQQPELIKIAGKAGLKLLEQDYFVLGFSIDKVKNSYNARENKRRDRK